MIGLLTNNVQNYWDDFESKIVKIVDKIVPLTEFRNDRAKITTPIAMKSKRNKRNRLLKSKKKNNSINEIKKFFLSFCSFFCYVAKRRKNC